MVDPGVFKLDWRVHIAIISHLRPKRVPKMQENLGKGSNWRLGQLLYDVLGVNATWYVGKGEADEYREAGAKNVVESGGLCESRNVALHHAFSQHLTCVQLSDDLGHLCLVTERKKGHFITFWSALGIILTLMEITGAKLGGVAPTTNDMSFNPLKLYSLNQFILGDFSVIKPCGLYYDENLKLKEDFDYALQHLRTFGKVVRSNLILATFQHRTNKGGAVAYRTPEREQKVIRYLMKKWPRYIKAHPKRENEVIMRWKPEPKRYPRLYESENIRFPRD